MDGGVDLDALLKLGGVLLAGGSAWGGALVALNGTRKRVAEVHETLTQHVQADTDHQKDIIDRLARIETKLESKARTRKAK